MALGGDTGARLELVRRGGAETVIGDMQWERIEVQSGWTLWMRGRSVRSCERASVRV